MWVGIRPRKQASAGHQRSLASRVNRIGVTTSNNEVSVDLAWTLSGPTPTMPVRVESLDRGSLLCRPIFSFTGVAGLRARRSCGTTRPQAPLGPQEALVLSVMA